MRKAEINVKIEIKYLIIKNNCFIKISAEVKQVEMCEHGGCMSKLSGIQLFQMLNSVKLETLTGFQDSAILPSRTFIK